MIPNFTDDTHSNLEPQPVPSNFKRSPGYIQRTIIKFLESDQANKLFSDIRRDIYFGKKVNNYNLIQKGIYKFIGLFIIYFQQEEFTALINIDMSETIPPILKTLERLDSVYTEKLPRMHNDTPILFPLVSLLNYKYNGKAKYYRGVLSIFSGLDTLYGSNLQKFPDNLARNVFNLYLHGVTISSSDPTYRQLFTSELVKYWPKIKNKVFLNLKVARKSYSDLGFIKIAMRETGYLQTANEVSKKRLQLTAISPSLTPSFLERSVLRLWGLLTDYGTSLKNLIMIYILLCIVTISGVIYNYLSFNLFNSQSIFKRALEVLHSFLRITAMMSDENIKKRWHQTLYHTSFFFFYTILFGQVLNLLSKNI